MANNPIVTTQELIDRARANALAVKTLQSKITTASGAVVGGPIQAPASPAPAPVGAPGGA